MFRPTASLNNLKKRAQVLADLRAFFHARGVMEADVPVLGRTTVTDPHLEPLHCVAGASRRYLQTSPEFFLKRLLAAGLGSVYYLGPAFRQDESGRHHRAEFTMLEWYRLGFNDRDLAREVLDLVARFAPDAGGSEVSYGDLFLQHCKLNPHRASLADLADLGRELLDFQGDLQHKSAWLDLLFSHVVQPQLTAPTIVYDYPAEQCALARLGPNDDGDTVAKRFELYWQGIELANGYWELTDAVEQRRRFEDDQRVRRELGLMVPEYDSALLAALESGLPDCSGVALGVDRLLMCVLNEDNIAEVRPFADG